MAFPCDLIFLDAIGGFLENEVEECSSILNALHDVMGKCDTCPWTTCEIFMSSNSHNMEIPFSQYHFHLTSNKSYKSISLRRIAYTYSRTGKLLSVQKKHLTTGLWNTQVLRGVIVMNFIFLHENLGKSAPWQACPFTFTIAAKSKQGEISRAIFNNQGFSVSTLTGSCPFC